MTRLRFPAAPPSSRSSTGASLWSGCSDRHPNPHRPLAQRSSTWIGQDTAVMAYTNGHEELRIPGRRTAVGWLRTQAGLRLLGRTA